LENLSRQTVYAVVLIFVTISFLFLANQLRRVHGTDSEFSEAFGGQFRSYITLSINAAAAIISLTGFPKSAFILMATSLMWFIPNWKRPNSVNTTEQNLELDEGEENGD
jgi:uncharacterized membrane protein